RPSSHRPGILSPGLAGTSRGIAFGHCEECICPYPLGGFLGPGSSLAGARSSGTRKFSCPGRVQRALLRERNETRDPAREARSAIWTFAAPKCDSLAGTRSLV